MIAPNQNEVLYLFSSNSSPLYEQDILDLLAAPRGHRYQFRYLNSWLEKRTRETWASLEGIRALLHFSIQQLAEYHEPAFIPVREAIVTGTDVLGNIYLVELELINYVTLSKKVPSGKPREVYGRSVTEYRQQLIERNIPQPYAAWAGLGVSVADLLDLRDDTGAPRGQMMLFERTTEFLSNSESFRSARYYRVLNLRESGVPYSSDLEEGLEPSEGRFTLRAGRSYQLLLAHTQPSTIQERQQFLVSADNTILRIIGNAAFEISSRYDLVKLHLHAAQSQTHEDRETVLAIDPSQGVKGPRLRLKIVVASDVGRTVAGVAGSATAAILLGIPALLPNLPTYLKFLFVVAATVLFGVLASIGLKRA